MTKYAIWSQEHRGYWKPSNRGYTPDPNGAGLYRLDAAIEICNNAAYGSRDGFPNESMLPEEGLKRMQEMWKGRK